MDPIETAFTTVGGQVSTMAGYAWPVVTSVMVALIGIGLFKKFISKAT